MRVYKAKQMRLHTDGIIKIKHLFIEYLLYLVQFLSCLLRGQRSVQGGLQH